MKLKCIGGRCDGMTVDIPEHARYRQGETVRVPYYPVTVSFDFNPEPTAVAVNNFIYIVDVLKYSQDGKDISEIWFLKPENFTMFDAIQYQFRK